MYIIINNTTRKNTNYVGNFPYKEIVEMLENDEDIIIISEYSNTIKVPYLDTNTNNYGETKSSYDWAFKEYHFVP